MTNKFLVAALAASFVGAYAMQPMATATAVAAPSPLAVQVAAASTSPSDAQIASGKWDVRRVHCSDLLNASEDDRASAAMFYYSYLAARYDTRIIDVTKISDNIQKVMQQCGRTPKMHITQAFGVALAHPHKK